jgi:hypothetical protein
MASLSTGSSAGGDMARETRRRDPLDSLEAALTRGDGAARYRRRQREIRRGRPAAADRPGPLEFDADGFPIPQPIPRFVRRVARLLRED